MRIKKLAAGVILIMLMIVSNYLVAVFQSDVSDEMITFQVEVEADESFNAKVYYLTSAQDLKEGFAEEQAVQAEYVIGEESRSLSFSVPCTVTYLRFDPCEEGGNIIITDMQLLYDDRQVTQEKLLLENTVAVNEENQLLQTTNGIEVLEGSHDPYFVWKVDQKNVISCIREEVRGFQIAVKIVVCVFLDVLLLILWRKRQTIFEVPSEIIKNRKLILSLAKNDFKTKFAGSYFGIIWAFVQPIVTVLVYWFVFEQALSAGAQTTRAGITVPYVLWLIAGLVPWFFFSEVLSTGTGALIEYSYLVKKVVFKISILPVVKIVSSLFVHLFFIAFTLILYSCYQYFPTVYTLQLIYYSFCMIMLCLGIVYATSAVVIFFRDLSQVINIVLQVGMWATPIMWNIDSMAGKVSPIILGVLKLNPMYYVVSGYRDALISQVWFWERPEITLYFWLFVISVFGVGFTIFRRLQVHFADVL